jgi:hypothetical protein
MMKPVLPVACALTLIAAVATADEFTDTLDGALQAYRDGDITAAQQDLDYAGKLLTAMKSESLAKFLPAAPAGWARDESSDAADASGVMGMFGGGTTASATYRRGDEEMTLTLIANSPMITGMAGMLSGIAAMGGGKPMRIQRTEFAMNDQDLQGVVGGKVMVSVGGNAAVEDKTALIETMDFGALEDF